MLLIHTIITVYYDNITMTVPRHKQHSTYLAFHNHPPRAELRQSRLHFRIGKSFATLSIAVKAQPHRRAVPQYHTCSPWCHTFIRQQLNR